eukprot:7376557-Prymnesium_polylepis.1
MDKSAVPELNTVAPTNGSAAEVSAMMAEAKRGEAVTVDTAELEARIRKLNGRLTGRIQQARHDAGTDAANGVVPTRSTPSRPAISGGCCS